MDLTFTSKKIDGLEKKFNKPVGDLLSGSQISVLVTFIRSGKDCTEEEAYAAIDEYRTAGKSTNALQIEIIEALEEQGFLEKSLGLSKKIKDQIAKVGAMDTLDAIGETMNQ